MAGDNDNMKISEISPRRQLPPEIVRLVMGCLGDDTSSLRSAILVNRSWATEGIGLLWQRPHVAALISIGDSRRRQFYARQVRYLNITSYSEAQHGNLRQLEFPRLKRVMIDCGYEIIKKEIWVGQYLQRDLEAFFLMGTVLAEASFDLLECRCQLLQEIMIQAMPQSVTPSRLLEFLENCRFLHSITLYWDVNNSINPIDDLVFAHLAGRDNLVELQLERAISYERIKRIFDSMECPLRDIEALQLRLPSRAIPLLTTAIRKTVTSIRLEIQDSEVMILPAVGSLIKLQQLGVTFEHDVELSGTDLLALKGLKDLRAFRLETRDAEISSFTFTNQDFIRLFEDMHNLEFLLFEIDCALTAEAIISLGRNCRQLEFCNVLGINIDIYALSGIQAPLLPQVHFLMLCGNGIEEATTRRRPHDSMDVEAQDIMHIIVEHVPKLNMLTLPGGAEGGLCEHVMKAFDARKEDEGEGSP